tara:strand:+ start:727 stop:1218 length:492 start_codon:yes stop_codon:yes gene_type:complete
MCSNKSIVFVGGNADAFIINEYLNIHNIITRYDDKNIYSYANLLFNKDGEALESYLDYIIKYGDDNIIIELLPICSNFLSQFSSGSVFIMNIIANKEWYKIFAIYALSIGKNIINYYRNYFNEVIRSHNNTMYNIAIKKLKRNTHVKNGIILKILIMRSGLFD